MSAPQAAKPSISASDRLGFTLFLALTLHAILVLGISFKSSEDSEPQSLPTLDIILANSKSFETPDNPDYLSQVDQIGGGNQEEKARPGAPVSANTPIDQKGLSDQAREELQKQQLSISQLYFLTQQEAAQQVDKNRQQKSAENESQQASEIDQRRTRIARLQAEIRQMAEDYAKRPKVLTLTASTRKAVEAGYLAAWVHKIEHTGNLNYPQDARIKQLDGRLRMSVRIDSQGRVLDVNITKSSGTTILDEAARRILRMAEPFPAFPDELKERADQIVIIRTWDFKSNRLTTENSLG